MTTLLDHLLTAIVRLAQIQTAPGEPSDDFEPIAALIMIFVIAICLILVGIGIAIAMIAAACAACLAALGIVSTSALIAAWRRRVSSGLRALHYQGCVAVGLPVGIVIAMAASAAFHLSLRLRSVVFSGALGGIAAGLLLALLGDLAARLIYRRVMLAVEAKRAHDALLSTEPSGSTPRTMRVTRLTEPPDTWV